MRAVVLIASKDLRLRLRDRSAVVMGVVAPFLLAFILNSVVGDSALNADAFSATFGLVDRDGGEMANAFVDAIDRQDAVAIDLVTGLSDSGANAAVEAGDVDAAFVIPEGFSEAVAAPGGNARLTVVGDVDDPIATQLATSVAEGFVRRLDTTRLSWATAAALGAPATASPDAAPGRSLVDAASGEPSPVRVTDLAAGRRQLDRTTYLVAGIGVLFLFIVVRAGVTDLLDERREGTLTRLLAAPIPRWAVPLAKTVTSVVLGTVSLTLLVLASTAVMGAHWGPPAAVALLVGAVVLAATALMGLVAAVARTPEQANGAQAVVALVLAAVGGAFLPVDRAGGLLAALARFTPHHWFLRGLSEASGGGVDAALPAAGVLLVFAATIGALGAVLVPRMVRR